ncbi:multifunctional oxoglutarate decarboxylase/oxoglutarate dehydrogenase thiamine pyrophosphate-binding subunit/dihydrolipoyllysine-residue succinyltransferase subunit [Actinomyces minihominis]|uniref:multifunctional oxoglutarate decarboxylase/oxoglutarate dehydrogenase thiamine pyrophosphate-binding subunit/dihydrolipoyllysine-residue succinyltransferase subunit n=1 Tax=Actinomyces minihominis TaxID=2002838 RepID=UPI002413F213|nr:multifunctional oxoglutarate decarboxylase/oxoglutarate dehydrogenase thiamine pyrophosphate-binding subunit/dihydrolipoyllysine-residue succinyltransferase subunit [Actinomyces minihominis]
MASIADDDLGPNDWYIGMMYDQFVDDPNSVDEQWRAYFEAYPDLGARASAASAGTGVGAPVVTDQIRPATEGSFSAEDANPGQVPEPVTAPAGQTNPVNVTRSDLPPAPPTRADEATSPYTRAKVIGAASNLGDGSLIEDSLEPIRGAGRSIVKNMESSLSVPTATSAREIPAKLLIENRSVINVHLDRTVGGKVSFTHLIAYALVESLVEMPSMNVRYRNEDGKAQIEHLAHVGLGIAIDVPRKDGSRSLLVPVVQKADTLTFPEFVRAMNDLIVRARDNKLVADDFQGASVSLTNPGTIGTTLSVPRLMAGQGAIIGIGATDYPAEWAGLPGQRLADLGVGKVMYTTSTYDHRVIQGAGSGQFLKILSEKLSGKDGFYDRIFNALQVPYPPYHWERDLVYDPDAEKSKHTRIVELIHAYRSRGHLAADTDPLAYRVRRHPDLELGRYGLTVWDLDREFPTGGFGGVPRMLLRDLLRRLRDTYTRSVGIEYMHIQDPTQRLWVQAEVEAPYEKPSPAKQREILSTLVKAEAFEAFLQTKYTGQKRFSLEGGESLIPLLNEVLTEAATAGLYEVTIGMAHRGRLNVLANLAGKSYSQIFSEFEGSPHLRGTEASGDVKYHLGTEGVFTAGDGVATRVYLAANPSHLEAVNGVVLGISRAMDDRLGEPGFPVMPILIHGDAAFIGQGVVYEGLNMSQLEGFKTGGTMHVIVNNQIGFTTGPTSGRSTRYPTDLAKGLQIPIFHVNGDDPEAVVRVAALAFKYREEFNKDVLIDLVCYRRRGHNEGDDPSMTQPVMYGLIDSLPPTLEVYTRNLVGRGDITEAEANEVSEQFESELNHILDETRSRGGMPDPEERTQTGIKERVDERYGLEVPESQQPGAGLMIGWDSAVTRAELERVGQAYNSFPEGFTPHKKLLQLSERRMSMARGETPIDWGFAELLAWGTMLMDGTPVRISGQDARRATFVQRHAVLHDQNDGREFTPLDFLTEDQAPLSIYDSPLSEYAPLAFEYGYSVERPEVFVAWEAQFGDFTNGAQTVIDEFISSAEQKWGQASSLTMLLPHGYEGQGPDHSSARIERYLALAAEDNMWVCQPSTPANHFHLTRQQAYRRPRTPLIEFTPKQLLRLTAATSQVEEFISGSFQPVIGEVEPAVNPAQVRKVLVCSGRIYYDLVKERQKRGALDVAIIRLEQFYPLATEEMEAALAPYGDAQVVWVQDEPANQGAWPFLSVNLFPSLGLLPNFAGLASGIPSVSVVSRVEGASPSTGLSWRHDEERSSILAEAFV